MSGDERSSGKAAADDGQTSKGITIEECDTMESGFEHDPEMTIIYMPDEPVQASEPKVEEKDKEEADKEV